MREPDQAPPQLLGPVVRGDHDAQGTLLRDGTGTAQTVVDSLPGRAPAAYFYPGPSPAVLGYESGLRARRDRHQVTERQRLDSEHMAGGYKSVLGTAR